jgi:hypothetical protein
MSCSKNPLYNIVNDKPLSEEEINEGYSSEQRCETAPADPLAQLAEQAEQKIADRTALGKPDNNYGIIYAAVEAAFKLGASQLPRQSFSASLEVRKIKAEDTPN